MLVNAIPIAAEAPLVVTVKTPRTQEVWRGEQIEETQNKMILFYFIHSYIRHINELMN